MLGPEGDVRLAADHGPGDCALTNLNAASPETLPPRRRHASFHLLKDDGVGSMVMITMAVGSMTSATGPCEIVINYANDLWEIHEFLVEAHLSAGRKTR
jgi:hypothetical protein